MIKIGFLIGKVAENPDRKDELDILKVEYKIVYSWKILKNYKDLGYSKEAFNCVQMLSENKVLGQKFLMGCRFLDPPCWGAIPCLSGN